MASIKAPVKDLVMSGVRRAGFALFMTARALVAPVALGVCALVENDEGQILLVRQRYASGWRLPGGGVGRFEPPAEALLRELKEEVGLTGAAEPEFFGLYTCRAGPVSNVVALYRVRGGSLDFRPNLEVSAIRFTEPDVPPADAAPSALHRLAELRGAPRSPYW